MLKKFKIAKQAELAQLQDLEQQGMFPTAMGEKRPGFKRALQAKGPGAVIAEYKRASPSKGTINLAAQPEEIALGYAQAGAAAISVLTEEQYFKGDFNFLFNMRGKMFAGGLGHNLPLLRKDFLFHPLQIKQTAASPASAYLLIVRMLDLKLLKHLIDLGREYGLEPVVEVFDDRDLELAQAAGADIIQVNNRDLARLDVNLNNSKQLIKHKKNGEFWISASGIDSNQQIKELVGLGFDAVLVGSSLMSAPNPLQALASLQMGKAEGD